VRLEPRNIASPLKGLPKIEEHGEAIPLLKGLTYCSFAFLSVWSRTLLVVQTMK
jgi:hypothetical protein